MQSVAVLLVSGFIASVLAADGKFGPRPKCNCEGLLCECCGSFTFRKDPKSVCIKANYSPNELTTNVELILDGNVISSRAIGPDFISFCVPAPPLNVCLNARQVFFSQNEAKICLGLDVKMGFLSIYKAQLPCLKMTGGQLYVTRN